MEVVERLTIPGSGLALAADASGPADAPVILFLHGSGQTRQSWRGALMVAAQRGYRGIALDMRGHGDSEWSAEAAYDVEAFAADLREVVLYIGGSPALVGASLGGLASLLVAASPPPPVGALVLVDIVPRVETGGAREVVSFMDSAPLGFASLEEAADAVSAYLPHRTRPTNTSGLARNLRLRNGRYYWHWDPAFGDLGRKRIEALGRQQAVGVSAPSPMENAARALTVPTLLIRGGRSRIVSDQGAREFLEMAPHAEFVDIPDAHHMVAGDANDAFNVAVFDFIDRHIKESAVA